MPNQKGKPRTGGRVAGTPNKRTQELRERLEQQFPGRHPVDAMAALGYSELDRIEKGQVVTPAEVQAALDQLALGKDKEWVAMLKKLATAKSFALDCLSEVAQYLEPKRKAIEHTGEAGEPLKLEIVLNG